MTTAAETDLEQIAASLDESAARVAALDEETRSLVTGYLDGLNRLHRNALITTVRRLREDPRGKELLFELVDDPAVRMMLSLHGIIRPDPVTAARSAVARLEQSGAEVELVDVVDGVAQVRLRGSGCASAAIKENLEQTLLHQGLRAVEIVPEQSAPAFIPLGALRIESAHPGWTPTVAVDQVPPGEVRALETTSESGAERAVIVVNVAGRLTAYVNACAHQGLPLDDAELDPEKGTLTCPWHGFCYDAADGECLSMPGAKLQSVPVRVEDGRIWVESP